MAELEEAIPRVERLRVEGLKLSCENAAKAMEEPSTAAIQQPVILEADRLSISPIPNVDEPSPFQECQIDALLKIFEYLALKERVKLSLTCRRFATVLTDKKNCPIRGLTVLNMFQKKVWVQSVRNNAISSLTKINITKIEHIVALLKHVRKIDCLKIWYQDEEFVNAVLAVFDPSVLVRNVDVYPYGSEIALTKVAEMFPRINAMTMRPHGSAHFYSGIKIASMPNFAHLNILSMDSFEPVPGFVFPSSIKSMDFGHRKLHDMSYLFEALGRLNLSYLSLSHLKFSGQSSIEDLIWSLSKMTKLEVLVLKFCHLSHSIANGADCRPGRDAVIETVSQAEWRQDADPKKDVMLSLKQVHFDLCYDVTPKGMYSLTVLSRKTIKNFSVSLLYEDEIHFNSVLALTPIFSGLNMGISFSVMQKDAKASNIKPHPKLPDEFHEVISRFEASYLLKPDLMANLFGKLCKNLQEIKFVIVPGLNDGILELIAANCPNLKKLSIISCEDTSEEGLIYFATNISQRRTSTPLKILYKTKEPNGAAILRLYGELSVRSTKDHSVHYTTKTFGERGNTGEALLFKDKALNRTVIFQSYTPEDSNHLLGLVIDIEEELVLASLESRTESLLEELNGLYSQMEMNPEVPKESNETDQINE